MGEKVEKAGEETNVEEVVEKETVEKKEASLPPVSEKDLAKLIAQLAVLEQRRIESEDEFQIKKQSGMMQYMLSPSVQLLQAVIIVGVLVFFMLVQDQETEIRRLTRVISRLEGTDMDGMASNVHLDL